MTSKELQLPQSDHARGIIFGVLAAVTFATYVLINRYVYIHYRVDGFKYTVTFLLAGGLFAGIGLAAAYHKRRFPVWDKRNLPVLYNGMAAGVGLGLFVLGQRYTTAVNATILATVTVITTAVYSKFLLRQNFSRQRSLWLLIMFVGLYVAIVGPQLIRLNKGDLIVIASSCILGFTNTFSKILMRHHSSHFIADVRLVSGGVLFGIIGIILNKSDFLVLHAGWWPLVAGFFFWITIKAFYVSIRYISPNQAIVLSNSHPIFTPVAAVLLLGEPYSWNKFIGSVVLLVSIYFISKGSVKHI